MLLLFLYLYVCIRGGFRILSWGGGGGALKKIAPSGGRRQNFWGISCEKLRFHAKKSYFFQFRREARTFLEYFVWKITILCKKNHIFSNFRGGARRVRPPPPPPPLDPPLCIPVGELIIKRSWDWIPFTGLTPSHFYAYCNPGF